MDAKQMKSRLEAIKLTDEEMKKIDKAASSIRRNCINISNPKQFYTDLYKMRYKLKLAPSEMMEFFNYSKRSIQYRLKQAGWEYSIYEAQQMSAKKKDYASIFKNMRKQWAVNNLSSNTENAARELLNIRLCEEINGEVIVGINNRALIAPYEIDIPIMICVEDKIYRYAVEFNGDTWHKERQCQDAIKTAMLINAGYKPFIIKQYGNTKEQSEYGSIEKQIENIVKMIVKDIKSNQKLKAI